MFKLHEYAPFEAQYVRPALVPGGERSIYRVKWRHRICGHDTIAILWVGYNLAQCVELMDEDLPWYIQTKFKQLVEEHVHVIINLPTKRI